MAHTILATFISASIGLLFLSTSVISDSSGQASSPVASFAGSSGDFPAEEASDSLSLLLLSTSVISSSSGQTSSPAASFAGSSGDFPAGDPRRGGGGAPPPSADLTPLPPAVPSTLPPAGTPLPPPPAVPSTLHPAGTPLPPPPATQAPSPATCLSCCKPRSRIIKKRGPNRWALVTGILASVISGGMILYFLVMVVFNLCFPNAFDGYLAFLVAKRERMNQIATEKNVRKAMIHGTVMCKLGIFALFVLLVSLKLGWIILQSWGLLDNAGPELDEIQQLLEAAAEVIL